MSELFPSSIREETVTKQLIIIVWDDVVHKLYATEAEASRLADVMRDLDPTSHVEVLPPVTDIYRSVARTMAGYKSWHVMLNGKEVIVKEAPPYEMEEYISFDPEQPTFLMLFCWQKDPGAAEYRALYWKAVIKTAILKEMYNG